MSESPLYCGAEPCAFTLSPSEVRSIGQAIGPAGWSRCTPKRGVTCRSTVAVPLAPIQRPRRCG